MTIVTIQTTVSHRYYAKQSKAEIIRRIHQMERQLGRIETATSELRPLTAYALASKAMALHREFPE